MDEQLLFTDVSVNSQTKTGFGAYLLLTDPDVDLESLKTKVKLEHFEHTSSTKLELQTLLWALADIGVINKKIIIYTDSQNILGLPKRRKQLEQSNYYSSHDKKITNYHLYQDFYSITDQMDYKLVQVKGHQKSCKKDYIEKVFTLVDRAARKALRNENKSKKT